MRYFFILGRTPELSILEICTLARSEGYTLSKIITTPHALICSILPQIPIEAFMARLGGTIKIGMLLQKNSINIRDQNILPLLMRFLHGIHAKKTERIVFGFSAYTLSQAPKKEQATALLLFRLGLSVKNLLKEEGASCRLVPCSDGKPFMSSVSVQKNHLLPPGGGELVFLEYDGSFFLGHTLAVQPFEEYSLRDWGRPQRDMNIGLLPPKLAQIMINLSGCSPSKKHMILDPFCGFGTILQEALLMGFSSVYGSDIDPHTVVRAEENLIWLAEKKHTPLFVDSVRVADATRLSQNFSPSSMDAIVTEPYLGPSIRSGSTISQKAIQEISSLYISFLKEAFLVLKKSGVLVLAVPVWLKGEKKIFLSIEEFFSSVGFVNATLLNDCTSSIQKAHRGTLLYSRAGQSVGREILILKKAR